MGSLQDPPGRFKRLPLIFLGLQYAYGPGSSWFTRKVLGLAGGASTEMTIVNSSASNGILSFANQVGRSSLISAANGGLNYTKSTMQLGQQIHKAYKLVDVVAMKEFRKIPGIRPDFVDFSTKTIYELKPYNPRAMRQGLKQLGKI